MTKSRLLSTVLVYGAILAVTAVVSVIGTEQTRTALFG